MKENGDQCKCSALSGEKLCYWHSDTTKAKRLKASGKGGAAVNSKVPRIPLRNMGDVLELLEQTVDDVRRFRSPQAIARARAVGYLCQIAAGVLEKADLEARLDALEAKLAG